MASRRGWRCFTLRKVALLSSPVPGGTVQSHPTHRDTGHRRRRSRAQVMPRPLPQDARRAVHVGLGGQSTGRAPRRHHKAGASTASFISAAAPAGTLLNRRRSLPCTAPSRPILHVSFWKNLYGTAFRRDANGDPAPPDVASLSCRVDVLRVVDEQDVAVCQSQHQNPPLRPCRPARSCPRGAAAAGLSEGTSRMHAARSWSMA